MFSAAAACRRGDFGWQAHRSIGQWQQRDQQRQSRCVLCLLLIFRALHRESTQFRNVCLTGREVVASLIYRPLLLALGSSNWAAYLACGCNAGEPNLSLRLLSLSPLKFCVAGYYMTSSHTCAACTGATFTYTNNVQVRCLCC